MNRSKCEGAGEGSGDYPILGNGVDGIAAAAPPTGRGGQSCKEGAFTTSVSERVVVPTSTVTKENARSDDTHDPPAEHMPSSDEAYDLPAEQTPSLNGATAPAATTVSQFPTGSARSGSDPTSAEHDALAEDLHQNTQKMKVWGAGGDEEVHKAKSGKCRPAQGTGTKAVRSLSQAAGGRALAEVEGEESSLLYESASGSGCRSLGRSLGEDTH